METWIALLRGINVGGNNVIKMADLKSDFESLKLKNVRTYVQSGNVVFDSTAKTALSLTKRICSQIKRRHGFQPQLLILNRNDLLAAINSNPFPKATLHPKTLHFFFLAEPAADPDIEAISNAKHQTENYKLTSNTFYLHAPNGIGRSKLAASVEKYLGVVTTARNFRTVEKLKSMALET